MSIQSIVSVSGRISPHSSEKFSISPLQAYSFRCWFSNNSVITFLEGCFPSSFVAEVGIFFSILLFQLSIFLFFRSGGIVVLFFSPIFLFGQDHVLFSVYPFNRSVVPFLLKFFSPYQVFHLFSTEVLPESALSFPLS